MASPARCKAWPASNSPPADTDSPSRSRPSLLPAFEPASSSPPLAISKRKFDELSPENRARGTRFYPTPVPTSSTGILQSSPPVVDRPTRPALQRTVSELQQRSPLGAVSTIEIPASGEPILLGRSTNSTDFQFSTNRLVSRIHISATYTDSLTAEHPHGELTVECLGWNGADIHYAGVVSKISKDEVFTATRPDYQLIVDVCDSRVLLQWPSTIRRPQAESPEGSSSEEELPPVRSFRSRLRDSLRSSPPPLNMDSPPDSVDGGLNADSLEHTFVSHPPSARREHVEVQIYEDSEEPEVNVRDFGLVVEKQEPRGLAETTEDIRPIKASEASRGVDDLSDHDEENDPIVHSFGPFGQNILPRFASINTNGSRDASFNASGNTPPRASKQSLKPQKSATASPSQASEQQRVIKTPTRVSKSSLNTTSPSFVVQQSPIKNHVVNQLAYSRVHSITLSTILGNLPLDLKGSNDLAVDELQTVDSGKGLTREALKQILQETACVGEISREGKDAAGKPLEDEYYYLPELDDDQARRDAVTGGMRGTGLRAVRKNHKQYYWKRPRC